MPGESSTETDDAIDQKRQHRLTGDAGKALDGSPRLTSKRNRSTSFDTHHVRDGGESRRKRGRESILRRVGSPIEANRGREYNRGNQETIAGSGKDGQAHLASNIVSVAVRDRREKAAKHRQRLTAMAQAQAQRKQQKLKNTNPPLKGNV